MTEPERENWQAIWSDLDGAGLTTYVIAKRMGKQFIQVQRMQRAKDLQDWEARFIRRLHAENVPGSRFIVSHET